MRRCRASIAATTPHSSTAMKTTLKRVVIAFLAILTTLTSALRDGFAGALTIQILVNPNQTEFLAGANRVILTAQAAGEQLRYEWKLIGVGKIEGDATRSAISYLPPNKVSGAFAKVILAVTATNANNESATASATLTILPNANAEESAPKKGGTGKKIMLGVGGAALLGGGVALALGGSSGDDSNSAPVATPIPNPTAAPTAQPTNEPEPEPTAQPTSQPTAQPTRQPTVQPTATPQINISGTYRGNPSSDVTKTFYLTQSGSSVSGQTTNEVESNCCTVVVSTSVSGSVSGTTFTYSQPSNTNTCRGNSCQYSSEIVSGTFSFTIVNNGGILRHSSGTEYYRQ